MAPARPDRRRAMAALAGAGLAVLATLSGGAVAAQDTGARVIIVARQRVLRETRAGRALREAETRLTAEFQSRVDEVKRQLEAEEAELARLRGSLARPEFDARTEAFDRKVRDARRESQREAAALQKAIREARDTLVRNLAPILIEVLQAEGADIILDADDVLVAAPSVDMTDEVIALFDARVEAPAIEVDAVAPPPGGPAGAEGE